MKNEMLREQMEFAKRDMIGKAYRNKKTKKVYYVKGVTIDTETYELRVIYNDGINIFNDWDRPLNLFIEKFEHTK